MSDADNKNASVLNPWTDHEALAYLFSAIEFSNAKIDFANAPTPAGRNASGCTQKMGRLKIALRAEIEAIKNGDALEVPAAKTTPKKKATPCKRKNADGEDGEGTPKKRGRPKKAASDMSESPKEEGPEDKKDLDDAEV